MTSSHLSYSAIDEAWGMINVRSAKKHKKRKDKKPVAVKAPCHLYDEEVNNGDFDDIFGTYHPYTTAYDDVPAREDTSNEARPSIDVFPQEEEEDHADAAGETEDAVIENVDWLRDLRASTVDSASFWEFATFVAAGILLIIIMDSMVQVGMSMRVPF